MDKVGFSSVFPPCGTPQREYNMEGGGGGGGGGRTKLDPASLGVKTGVRGGDKGCRLLPEPGFLVKTQ